MSYQVLARKWRPRTFKDMVGQAPILQMLSNALKQKRIHHAYLFTGTRGVGKTTLARILAKCLNCEAGPTAVACNTCAICLAIDQGKFLDLYEIDAASRTKVEDTRELLDNVLYPPAQGRYKVYLIDEVHMLSNHSFNALLKTLEEPPEHVKFVLATTDPKRLPITILSRCLQFNLKHLTLEQISTHIEHICQKESIPYEKSALDRLAKAADGSLRDALSLLDQALAFCQQQISFSDVKNMLGAMASEDLIPLLNALADKNGANLFKAINALAEHTTDFGQALSELIDQLHQMAIAQLVPGYPLATELAALRTQFSPEDIQLYYQIALLGRRDLSLATTPKQGFEMTLLRMLAFKPHPPTSPPEQSLDDQINTPLPADKKKIAASIEKNIRQTGEAWQDLLPQLNLTGMAYALASNCVLESHENNVITLALSPSHLPMLNKNLEQRIQAAFSRHFDQSIQLKIKSAVSPQKTPVQHLQNEKERLLQETKAAILKEPLVKHLVNTYEADVDVSLCETKNAS